MSDIVKALRSRATWETATGITEPHEHIDWMAAREIIRLREENARLREDLSGTIERMSKLDFERTAAEFERDALREENARLREALEPFAEMELWTDTYPDGPIEATGKKRFVDPLWVVAARAAIREGKSE